MVADSEAAHCRRRAPLVLQQAMGTTKKARSVVRAKVLTPPKWMQQIGGVRLSYNSGRV